MERIISIALRRLARRPLLLAACTLGLGAGIGALAALVSASAAVLRPVPVHDPDTLAMISVRKAVPGTPDSVQETFAYQTYRQFTTTKFFRELVGVWWSPVAMPVHQQRSLEASEVAFVSGNCFRVFGVQIPIGRAFSPEDDRRDAAPVAILTHRYWKSEFNGDRDIVGRTIKVNATDVTVIGVAAPGFVGLNLASSPVLYMPLELIGSVAPSYLNYYGSANHEASPTAGLGIIARLRSSEDKDTAARALEDWLRATRLDETGRVELISLSVAAVPKGARDRLVALARVLGVTVVLLLVVGCSTIAMLLLVRSESRLQEFAISLALGGGRAELAAGVFAEGCIIVCGASAVALFTATWFLALFTQLKLPNAIDFTMLDIPARGEWRLIIVAAAVLATIGVACVASIVMVRSRRWHVLAIKSNVGGGRVSGRVRTILLAVQVALACTLTAGTVGFGRALWHGLAESRSRDGGHLVISGVSAASEPFEAAAADALFERLRVELRRLPTIQSVSTSTTVGGIAPGGTLDVDGARHTLPSFTAFHYVDSDYFRTTGVRLLDGRNLSPDDRLGMPPIALISQSLARHLNIAQAGNQRIALVLGNKLVASVVGIVEDLHLSPRDSVPFALYMPMSQKQMTTSSRTVLYRSRDPAVAQRDFLRVCENLDPRLKATRGTTLSQRFLRAMAPQRLAVTILAILATVSLALTMLCTYAVAASVALARSREMAIRAALGASAASMRAELLKGALMSTLLGTASGTVMAEAGLRGLGSGILAVDSKDPLILLAPATIMFACAITASLAPVANVLRGNIMSRLAPE